MLTLPECQTLVDYCHVDILDIDMWRLTINVCSCCDTNLIQGIKCFFENLKGFTRLLSQISSCNFDHQLHIVFYALLIGSLNTHFKYSVILPVSSVRG